MDRIAAYLSDDTTALPFEELPGEVVPHAKRMLIDTLGCTMVGRRCMSVNPRNETMQHAITEVQVRIMAVYPNATFHFVEGEDPIGFYLDAYTDAEDAFAVLDLVSDWLVDLSVNAGGHLHVIPLPQEAVALYISKQP